MAGAAFSIKLRCASWPQLATIYRRDLSRGQMFLKASNQPPIGTLVRIDLELPSATVIELEGTIFEHLTDPQRGTGVNLKLEPLPTKTVWMIESALAAENKVRASSQSDGRASSQSDVATAAPSTNDGEEVAAAETELVRALEAEAESLRKLNPFLVLGVGYETTDSDVRAAFGELTKRYHPDRFVRYQSQKLRQIAAEIFILIRDAYRRLADEKGRQQVLGALGPKTPTRTATPPRGGSGGYPAVSPPAAVVPERRPSEKMPALTPPPVPTVPSRPRTEPGQPAGRSVAVPPIPAPPGARALTPHETPTAQTPYDAPTNPSAKSAELAHTELARTDLAVPQDKPALGGQGRPTPQPTVPFTSSVPVIATPGSLAGQRRPTPAPVELDTSAIETMLDAGKLDDAINAYRTLLKRHPQDKGMRAGVELVEGLKALVARDRMEAAQRFEAALELDPSNERAARELAEMRRQATNERKGLLSRLMGKKEP